MEREIVKRELTTFSEEVMSVLDHRASTCISERRSFQIYDATMNVKFFSENVKKAVFTLAYLFRAKCKVLYRKNYLTLCSSSENYGEFLMRREIPEDRYFLRFLAWISFAFEMTMYIYRKEYEASKRMKNYERYALATGVTPQHFIDTCKQCIVNRPNMDILADEKRETKWWEEIQDAANRIAAFHHTLAEALGRLRLKKDILPSFQVALKNILKLKECKLTITEINMFRYRSVQKYYRASKLQTLSEYRPYRIVLGHIVVRRNEHANPTYLRSKSSSREAKWGHSSQGNVQMVSSPSTSSGVCNVDLPRSNVSNDEQHFKDSYKDPAFVVSSSKRNRVRHEEKTGIRDIKIYVPQKEIMGEVQGLYTVLKDNVEKPDHRNDKLIETFSNNKRPEAIVKQGFNPIIVMDSSEEEEDDDEPFRRSFIDNVLKNWKEFSLDEIEVIDFALNSRNWVGPEE